MSRTTAPAHIDTIETYYRACNTADAALMTSTLTGDVVHYFVDHAPVRGADALASYLLKIGPRTRAQWRVEHALVAGDEAVIEWSMHWTPIGEKKRQVLRGTEWFVFRDGRIAEIRAYHNNWYLRDPENFQLRDFDYRGRGYEPD